MPEGDSLHRAAARLQVLVGERVFAESPHPRGLVTRVAEAVDGRTLERVEAVGKHLFLHFAGNIVLRSHLGMRGRWRVEPAGSMHAGLPWLILRGASWQAVQWNGPVLSLERRALRRLGPDLLADDTSVRMVVSRARHVEQTRLVGEALVDQSFVAGIGNRWLAETLWHARLSPWLPLADVSDEVLEEALTWARTAMRAAVEGPRAAPSVYRRAGRPCPRCGTRISSRGLGDANRTAYWCPGCQRGAPAPTARSTLIWSRDLP